MARLKLNLLRVRWHPGRCRLPLIEPHRNFVTRAPNSLLGCRNLGQPHLDHLPVGRYIIAVVYRTTAFANAISSNQITLMLFVRIGVPGLFTPKPAISNVRDRAPLAQHGRSFSTRRFQRLQRATRFLVEIEAFLLSSCSPFDRYPARSR